MEHSDIFPSSPKVVDDTEESTEVLCCCEEEEYIFKCEACLVRGLRGVVDNSIAEVLKAAAAVLTTGEGDVVNEDITIESNDEGVNASFGITLLGAAGGVVGLLSFTNCSMQGSFIICCCCCLVLVVLLLLLLLMSILLLLLFCNNVNDSLWASEEVKEAIDGIFSFGGGEGIFSFGGEGISEGCGNRGIESMWSSLRSHNDERSSFVFSGLGLKVNVSA